MAERGGIEKYTLLILLVADRARASHIRITPAGTAAVVELWRDGAWHESDLTERSQPFHLHVMRQLATMMSTEVPPQDHHVTGKIHLVRGEDKPPLYVLAAIDHDFEVSAHLEIVDELTFRGGRPPRPPTT